MLARQLALILSAAAVLAGCTRKTAETSRISFQLPHQSTSLLANKTGDDVSALDASKWFLADPSLPSDINCYAIAVEAPDATTGTLNSCQDLNAIVRATPRFIAGGFAPGSTQELEVASGADRKIILIGFHTDDVARCVPADSLAAGLANDHFSAPFILAQTTVTLAPGIVPVTLNMPSTMAGAQKIEECLPFKFSRAEAVEPLILSSISPATGVSTGATSVTLTGSGFTPATTISIGGTACTAPVYISATSMTCTTAAHTAGTVAVTVNRGMYSASLAGGYSYYTLPELSVADFTVSEGNSFATVTVLLSSANIAATTFNYATSDGTAAAGADYTSSAGTATVSIGMTSTSFTVPLTNDSLYEAGETFNITLSSPSANATISDAAAVVTITDNDTAPGVSFAAMTSSVIESDGTVTATVNLSAASGQTASVDYVVSGTADGSDHNLANGTVVFTPGDTSEDISITLTDDAALEAPETIVITMSNPVGASYGAITVHTMTVSDNEIPTATISGAPTGSSNGTALAVTVAGTQVVSYVYSAHNGSDCTAAAYGGSSSTGTTITSSISALTDGPVTLCVKGTSSSGVPQVTPTSVTWIKDTAAPSYPSGIALNSPATSPANDNTPTLTVSGVTSGDTIQLYTDASCITQVASGVAAGSSVNLTTSSLSDGSYSIHAKAIDAAGNASACSTGSATYTLDTVAPVFSTFWRTANIGTSLEYSPYYSWLPATDAGVGLSHYDVAIGTGWGGSDVMAWTPVGTMTSYYAFGLGLVDGLTYFYSVRAIDLAGNIVALSDTFTVDVTPAWMASVYVKAGNNDMLDEFGTAVAVDGDFMVVGAPLESSNDSAITNGPTSSADNSAAQSGAVYVYKWLSGSWVQSAYIKPTNNYSGNKFGTSVDISGNTIVVGVESDASNQTTITNGGSSSANRSLTNAGAVFVYKFDGTNWAQEAYLKAPNAAVNNYFGRVVAIDKDTIVVGSSAESSASVAPSATAPANSGSTSSGAAYVFVRAGNTWSFQSHLKADNAGANDQFGTAVDIFGDTIVVGAVNEASTATTTGLAAAVGSSNNSATNAGAAYVFKRTGTTWAQQAYLKPSWTSAADAFGRSVSLFEDTIVVGAYGEDSNASSVTNGVPADNNSLSNAGAAYVYQRTSNQWYFNSYLKPSDPLSGDAFGWNVAVFGTTIAVSAPAEESCGTAVTYGTAVNGTTACTGTGAVYLFQRQGTNWSQQAYLKTPNSGPDDSLGGMQNLAVYGGLVFVGAHGEDSNQNTVSFAPGGTDLNTDSGAVYIFDVP